MGAFILLLVHSANVYQTPTRVRKCPTLLESQSSGDTASGAAFMGCYESAMIRAVQGIREHGNAVPLSLVWVLRSQTGGVSVCAHAYVAYLYVCMYVLRGFKEKKEARALFTVGAHEINRKHL